MRYIVIKNKDSSPFVAIWSESQHQIEIKPNIFRECTHYDYLKKNHISSQSVSSVGMVYCDLISGIQDVVPADWITPAPTEDDFFVRKAAVAFCKKHPDLKAEIQSDWKIHKAWEERLKKLKSAHMKSQ